MNLGRLFGGMVFVAGLIVVVPAGRAESVSMAHPHLTGQLVMPTLTIQTGWIGVETNVLNANIGVFVNVTGTVGGVAAAYDVVGEVGLKYCLIPGKAETWFGSGRGEASMDFAITNLQCEYRIIVDGVTNSGSLNNPSLTNLIFKDSAAYATYLTAGSLALSGIVYDTQLFTYAHDGPVVDIDLRVSASASGDNVICCSNLTSSAGSCRYENQPVFMTLSNSTPTIRGLEAGYFATPTVGLSPHISFDVKVGLRSVTINLPAYTFSYGVGTLPIPTWQIPRPSVSFSSLPECTRSVFADLTAGGGVLGLGITNLTAGTVFALEQAVDLRDTQGWQAVARHTNLVQQGSWPVAVTSGVGTTFLRVRSVAP